jgi:hypothetical protein
MKNISRERSFFFFFFFFVGGEERRKVGNIFVSNCSIKKGKFLEREGEIFEFLGEYDLSVK